MISRELQHVLALRGEIQDLFHSVSYGIDGKRNTVEQLKQIATRAIAIFTEWPDEFWPLEDEQELWPDKPDVINLLKVAIAKADAYRPTEDFSTEFAQWSEINGTVFGALYYFRPPSEPDEFDKE